MSAARTDWQCACGKVRARVDTTGGTRLTCHCRHCRSFARITGHPEDLGPGGESHLFQTAPERFEIVEGAEHLASLKLTDKGPVRWYAACCGSPVANTLDKRTFPFVSLQIGGQVDPGAYGPIRARAFQEQALGTPPTESANIGGLMGAFILRMIWSLASGGYRRNPFFKADGSLIAEPRRITDEERKRGYDPG